jgi:hypothetical protein
LTARHPHQTYDLRQDARMKSMHLLPLVIAGGVGLAACSSGPSEQDAARMYGAANTAMSTARVQAVSQAQTAAPGDVALDFSGPCTLGGTVALMGTSSTDTASASATFDLLATFAGCHEAQGTLDGSLGWSSSSSATGTTMSMTGDLDWSDGSNSASCEINVLMSVGATGFSYTGSICGYDVATEINLGP